MNQKNDSSCTTFAITVIWSILVDDGCLRKNRFRWKTTSTSMTCQQCGSTKPTSNKICGSSTIGVCPTGCRLLPFETGGSNNYWTTWVAQGNAHGRSFLITSNKHKHNHNRSRESAENNSTAVFASHHSGDLLNYSDEFLDRSGTMTQLN